QFKSDQARFGKFLGQLRLNSPSTATYSIRYKRSYRRPPTRSMEFQYGGERLIGNCDLSRFYQRWRLQPCCPPRTLMKSSRRQSHERPCVQTLIFGGNTVASHHSSPSRKNKSLSFFQKSC